MANITAEFNTNMGNFKIELFMKEAPLTVGNFIKLIEKGFYNGLIFHRVIPNFMIQTGCPQGTGYGGPGYTIRDEFDPNLKHDTPGILSMANAGPNTGGSQFFITVAPTPWLDGKHAIFGKVTQGMDIVDKISKVQTGRADKPLQDVVIKNISIK
jgi:peptidyl-prolyl cis-trans isomerase A (cyclophilin A)